MSDTKCNTNLLDGMRCPRCGSYEPFAMSGIIVEAVVYDKCTEGLTEIEWYDEVWCQCGACDFPAVVGSFREEPTYRCGNCAAQYHDFDQLRPARRLDPPRDPEESRPSGACPACAAFCYLEVPEPIELKMFRVTVLAVPEDPQETPIRLGSVSIDAEDEEEAKWFVLLQLWDDKLNSAGFLPAAAVRKEETR